MARQTTPHKKLRIGWFSFSCCEDSTIILTEMLNDHFEEWSQIIEFAHMRVLKSKNSLKDLDVAFVEGAIASKRDEQELQDIRRNCKKLIAIGSCACTGMPSAQRNNFSEEKLKEIEALLKKFHQASKVKKLEQIVKVDDMVPGCPMQEKDFLQVLTKTLQEFNIIPHGRKKS